MREITITQKEQALTCSEPITLQQYESNITKLIFQTDANINDFVYAGFGRSGTNDYILKELDDKYGVAIDSSITRTPGRVQVILLCTNKEIIDGKLSNTGYVYITKPKELITVSKNFINGAISVIPQIVTDTSHIVPTISVEETDTGVSIKVEDRDGVKTANIPKGTGSTVDLTGYATKDYVTETINEIQIPESTPVKGKKFLFMGDSITANPNGYISYVANILGITTTNMAVNGATWRDRNDSTNTIYSQLKNVVENQQNYIPDAIVISAGTNDSIATIYSADTLYTAMEPFYTNAGGVVNLETVDRKNIFGATRYVVETLKKIYPNADIFLLSPIQSAINVKDYKVALSTGIILQEVAKRLSVNFIDCNNCGITTMNADLTLVDGLHPNDTGAKLHGQYVANKILNFYTTQRFAVFSNTVQSIITLDSTTVSTTVGAYQQIKASVYPYTVENKNIIWSSSNEVVATVSNGYITGAGIGTCTVTAKAEADQTKTLVFNVTISVAVDTGLIFEANELGITGDTWKDNITNIPANLASPVTASSGVVVNGKFDFNVSGLNLGTKTDFAVVVDAYIPDDLTDDSLLLAIGSDTITGGDENDNILFFVDAWNYDMGCCRVISNWTYSEQKSTTYVKNASNKIVLNVSLANNTVTIYTNGTLSTTVTHAINASQLKTISNASGTSTPFSGRYNSIQIYNHLLTSEEIASL
ncbi:GDSL-type esterase/lipase family protein [Anaerosacchariphilus polymeriproducens]|uniref:BIG2 domain-containing protein n=1 Tax=Anaerosacchariphilus polymeriproducens TaxID=1812858 RepID=A0A371AQV0_9FIRM|nr:GDSL-type esterase/lipase family protein [Anaerosacchariphilus polymeriproducens]RDU21946.1 hypothetical protein DWV06_15525 [Anaerosacchariphilus polymeriproducens]